MDHTPEVLDHFAAEMRDLLDDPDPRLADPAAYHLWCGEFEGGPEDNAWIWAALTEDIEAHPLRLRRLLPVSGPVVWTVKRDLLQRLHDSPEWRDDVRQALEHARHDYFGSIDEADVQTWDG